MKKIPLSNGKYALIDDEDFEMLSQHKWSYLKSGRGYAYRNEPIGSGRRKAMLMHRVIAGTPEGMETDHINGDGLDNRRSNLRNATRSQNRANSIRLSGASSGYRGVRLHQRGRWEAQITKNTRTMHIGFFDTKEEAALAYNKAAREIHGEFAKLNTI